MYDGYCTYSIPDTGYTEKNPPAECAPNPSFEGEYADDSSTEVEKIDSCGERIVGKEIISSCQASTTAVAGSVRWNPASPDELELLPCSSIGTATCNQTPGCSTSTDGSTCEGTRTPCDPTITDAAECSANPGCIITSLAKVECEIRPVSEMDAASKECIYVSSQCDQHAENPSSCNAEPGCYYQDGGTAQSAQCSGTPTDCGGITEEAACNGQPGCSFSDGVCDGTLTATSCDGADESSCNAVNGCNYIPATQGGEGTCRPLEEGDKISSYDHLMNSYKCNESSDYFGTVDLKYSLIGGDGSLLEMNSDIFNDICPDDSDTPTHELTLGGCELQEPQVIESETCGGAFTRMTGDGTVSTACGARGWKYDFDGNENYSAILDEIPCGHGDNLQCLPAGDNDGKRIFENACCKKRQPCYTYDSSQASSSTIKKTCGDVEKTSDGIPTYIEKTVPTGFSLDESVVPMGKNGYLEADPVTGVPISWDTFDQQLCKGETCNFDLRKDVEACCTEPGKCNRIIKSADFRNYNMDNIIDRMYPSLTMSVTDKERQFCGEGDIRNNMQSKMKELPASFDLEEDGCSTGYDLSDEQTCDPGWFYTSIGRSDGTIILGNTATPGSTPPPRGRDDDDDDGGFFNFF